MSEPLKRVSRVCFYDPMDMKPGVFARIAVNSSGRVGLSSNCIACVMGSKDSPGTERKCLVKERRDESHQTMTHLNAEPVANQYFHTAQTTLHEPMHLSKQYVEAQFQYSPQVQLKPVSFPSSKSRQTLADWRVRPQAGHSQRNVQSCSIPRKQTHNAVTPASTLVVDCRTDIQHQKAALNYGAVFNKSINSSNINGSLLLSNSSISSCDSLSSLSSLDSPPMLPPCSVFDSRKRAVGTLQRELNALFTQKMEELHLKSPMFFAGKISVRQRNPVEALVWSIDFPAYKLFLPTYMILVHFQLHFPLSSRFRC